MTSLPEPEPIRTSRLVLEPVSAQTAQRLIAGDLSGLTPGTGWPHEDTMDGLGFVARGEAVSWLVTLDGATVGDCGTLGGVDAEGLIEIGYGLAAPYRGKGYGTELVGALSRWLLARPAVRRVGAQTLADNVASQVVLERAGFRRLRAADGILWYELSGSA